MSSSSVSSSSQPSKSLIAVLMMLVVFCPLAIDIYLPAFVVMANDFQVSQQQLQQTVAIFMLTVGLGQLIAGPLADKIGRRPIALAGIVIYALAAAAGAMARDLNWLLVARALQGFGACATFVAAFAIVRDVFGPARSGQILTYLNGVVCLIPALAPILGAWLTLRFNWQSNFIFMLIWAVFGALATWFIYRETRPQDSHYQGHIFDLRRFTPILRHPVFLFNGCITMLTMGSILMFVTSAPGWIIEHLGEDIPTFTLWFSINGAISMVACFIAPQLIKRSSRRALRLGLTLMLVCAIALVAGQHSPHAAALMIPMFVGALGYALILGSAAGAALAPFAKQAGTASALVGVMQMSGAGVLVLLTQSLPLTAPALIALHIAMLLPFWLILLGSKGRMLHK
ncbi:multidrug effflux MFS transporter [Pseudoalteromonas sp. BDTF-M6]|uniref:multidrug effflux MFS transporter n=1 Tax=Pseudoalteromonas sp. BDTF-M6 TaxID=2796132 RepID=UPI0032D58F8E